MDKEQTEDRIRALLYRFDEIVASHESLWGIGRIQNLVEPELAQRWKAHVDNLNDALARQDVTALTDIVEGTARGIEALEQSARDRGHVPNVEYWTGKLDDGREFRVYKTHSDSLSAQTGGVISYSLEEIGRLIAANSIVNEIKETFAGAKITGIADK